MAECPSLHRQQKASRDVAQRESGQATIELGGGHWKGRSLALEHLLSMRKVPVSIPGVAIKDSRVAGDPTDLTHQRTAAGQNSQRQLHKCGESCLVQGGLVTAGV